MNDRMTVALRVLTSIQDQKDPSPWDVALLRGWVSSRDQGEAADVLACIIIDQEVKRQKADGVMQHNNGRSA